ncbi:stage V sporulation T C-terminal domain-containing protein [Oscillospiraceae bacterium PP1C4]
MTTAVAEKTILSAYCRISVDEELDRDNTSIENQKAIISEFVKKKFPDCELVFYEDRDRSGYTFEQREQYQRLRPRLMSGEVQTLIVKDFSRFSRRNSKGLVELEDLRDAGVRIISIGDNIDYPTYDDWTAIQFRFLINEMPVTDTSKKVKSVISRAQSDGKWICAVPYGYVMTNSKTGVFEIDETAAEVVRKIYALYKDGWGYKKIANYLTEQKIPTPRMLEIQRKEARGEESKRKARPEWSIITVSEIIANDFYIGTLRQRKYTRKKINGVDKKLDESEHIVFENHHEPIIDYRIFAKAQEQLKRRTKTNYRGVKKYENVYSGFLYCGDCGSPMFSMSRPDLAAAYTCGSYHRRGRAGCTSHHTRVDILDKLLKRYVRRVMEGSEAMIAEMEHSIKDEAAAVRQSEDAAAMLETQLVDTKEQLKALAKQKLRETIRKPDQTEMLDEMYAEIEKELTDRIKGLQNQLELAQNRRNSIIRINRVAKTAFGIFDDILSKDSLDKSDLEIVIDKIVVYEDHIDIKLKSDIDSLLRLGVLEEAVNFNSDSVDSAKLAETIVQTSVKRRDKVYTVNIISNGDPLEIYTDNDGEVIFKKYSPIGELSSFASQYAEVLSKTGGYPVVVCDRDHVISVAGIPKKELLERRVSPALEEVMEQRRSFAVTNDGKKLQPVEGVDRFTLVQAPIVAAGDVCGSIMFIAGESSTPATDTEIKLIQVGAAFLGRQMEE